MPIAVRTPRPLSRKPRPERNETMLPMCACSSPAAGGPYFLATRATRGKLNAPIRWTNREQYWQSGSANGVCEGVMELGFRSPTAKRVGGVLILLGGITTGVLPFLATGSAFLDNPYPMSFALFALLTVCSSALGTMPGVMVGKIIDIFNRRN